jgi:hypothetical protein
MRLSICVMCVYGVVCSPAASRCPYQYFLSLVYGPPPNRNTQPLQSLTLLIASFCPTHLPYTLSSITSLLPRFAFQPSSLKPNPRNPYTNRDPPSRISISLHSAALYIFCNSNGGLTRMFLGASCSTCRQFRICLQDSRDSSGCIATG